MHIPPRPPPRTPQRRTANCISGYPQALSPRTAAPIARFISPALHRTHPPPARSLPGSPAAQGPRSPVTAAQRHRGCRRCHGGREPHATAPPAGRAYRRRFGWPYRSGPCPQPPSRRSRTADGHTKRPVTCRARHRARGPMTSTDRRECAPRPSSGRSRTVTRSRSASRFPNHRIRAGGRWQARRT